MVAAHNHALHGASHPHLHKRDAIQHQVASTILDNKSKFLQEVHQQQDEDTTDDVDTVASVVFVTMSQTFTGDAGMSTATSTVDASEAAAAYASAKAAAQQPADDSTAKTTAATSESVVTSVPTAVAADSSDASSSNDTSSSGMSGGAKAGIAIGVLLALAVVGGLVFLFWRRRKAKSDKSMDEKHSSFFFDRDPTQDNRSLPTTHSAAATAPRLSLRPVTNFLPAMGGSTTAAAKTNAPTRQNPFDDTAVISEKPSAVTAAAAADSRSSQSSQSSYRSAASNEAAATAPPTGPNNVHRVQLEFKPSMDDELELTSGHLVRMLHEYDDGWALCIRMDRSQQGVCPRTCLSKLPVKPRPHPSQGSSSLPHQASGPAIDADMVPRALTPTSPHARDRSETSSGHASPTAGSDTRNRAQTQTSADSSPSSKPAPGQAM